MARDAITGASKIFAAGNHSRIGGSRIQGHNAGAKKHKGTETEHVYFLAY
ncbi:hypothetical protein LJR029_006585 [Caballeronia sp. LjRoot29]